jgi:hypothetical protein
VLNEHGAQLLRRGVVDASSSTKSLVVGVVARFDARHSGLPTPGVDAVTWYDGHSRPGCMGNCQAILLARRR